MRLLLIVKQMVLQIFSAMIAVTKVNVSKTKD
jgi:hypothetical protein